MVFLMLMMIKTVFSQTIMEIYAYNYISQCKVEKSSRKDTILLKSSKNNGVKEQLVEKKIKGKQIKENQIKRDTFSFILPVEGGVTSSWFGDTVDRASTHKGHDWAVPDGTTVRSSERGVVELAYYSQSYGYNVLVRHSELLKTRYAHMSELYVKQGEPVERGEILGLSGSTGDSTGPHLHFEVIKNGIRINPMSVFY